MRKSVFRFACAMGIFLLIAITLTVGGRDKTSIVTPQIQDKVNEASYQAQDRVKEEEARLAPQFEEKPEPVPTPEPMPPVTELCMRMQWFEDVSVIPEELPKLSSQERREYWKGRNALVAALEYHYRQNSYRQSLGCSKYPLREYAKPANYLINYMDVLPRSLVIRLVRPEVADTLRILRSSATYNDLYQARDDLQSIRNNLKLTKRELISLGVTSREILEAEIEFIDDSTGN